MIYPPSIQIQSLPGAGIAVAFNLVGDALVIRNTNVKVAYVYRTIFWVEYLKNRQNLLSYINSDNVYIIWRFTYWFL